MKRIFSIILAVAMIMTMITVPASAAVNMTVTNTASTTNGGLFGKAANEYSMLMRTGAGDDNKANYIVSSKKDYDFSDSKYVVLDLNVAPTAAATYFTAGPNAGIYTLNNIRAFNYDQWNSVRVVLEEMTKDAMIADQKYQPMTMYVNGVKVAEGRSMVNSNDELSGVAEKTATYGKGFRFSVFGPASSDVAYFADAKISESNENIAPVMPTLDASAAYVINGDKVVVNGSATVADVTAGSATVRVYNKGKLITDTTTVLQHGDEIVVEDSINKIYSYYDVYEKGVIASADDVASFNSAGFRFGHASSTVVGDTGLFEKADDDESIKITEASNGNQYMYIYQQFDEELYLVNGQRRKDYIVVDVNVRNVDYASTGFMRFAMSTNQTALVSDTKFDTFNANGWTHLRLVYSAPEGETYKYVDWKKNIPNVTEDPDIIGKAIGHSVVYVNGVKKNEQDIKVTASATNSTGTNFTSTLNDLLLEFWDGDTANKRSVYVDDLKIYTSETDPGAPSAVELKAGGKYTADNSGKIIGFTEPITLNDIKTANPNVSLVAFTDGTYTTQIADDTVLEIGTIVTAKAENGLYAIYTVEDKTLLYKQTNAAGFGSKHGATYSDVSDDIAGKSGASVKIARGEGLNQQTYIELDYGKPMSIDTPEYVVLEMNYLPASKSDGFSIAGQMSASLTADFKNKLVTGQWNNIVVIYTNGSTKENHYPGNTKYTAAEPTENTPDTNSKNDAIKASPHSYEVYVNGDLAVSGGPGTSVFGMNWENKSYRDGKVSTTDRKEQYFRILAPAARNYGAYTAYIDDVVFREVNTIDKAALTAMPQLPAVEGLNVVGSFIELISDVAIDALPEGVTVYTDATYSTKVTEGNLVNGYKLAYTDGVNVSYYTIEIPADKIFADYSAYDSKWAKITNGTTSAATGINGEENGAFLVYSTDRVNTPDNPATPDKDEAHTAEHNGFFAFDKYDTDFFGERPYSIFSVDFKYEADGKELFFASNGHAEISSHVSYKDPRLVDGWNNLVCVVDYETNKSITYVNGIASTPITSVVGKDLQKTDIRLVIFDRGKDAGNANDANVPVATFDNIKVYASVTNPFAAPFTYEATADNVTFTACDYIKNGYEYVVIAAAYDENDNLVGNVAIGTDTVTIAKNAAAAYYRGYLWNSTDGVIPVTQAVTVK